jgi:hypothetical protein
MAELMGKGPVVLPVYSVSTVRLAMEWLAEVSSSMAYEGSPKVKQQAVYTART